MISRPFLLAPTARPGHRMRGGTQCEVNPGLCTLNFGDLVQSVANRNELYEPVKESPFSKLTRLVKSPMATLPALNEHRQVEGPAHQVPGRAWLRPRPKRGGLSGRRYVCIIWIRLPQVSSKTAIVTLGNSVGSIVKATPNDFSFSYSARMSKTLKDATGMPWSNIPF